MPLLLSEGRTAAPMAAVTRWITAVDLPGACLCLTSVPPHTAKNVPSVSKLHISEAVEVEHLCTTLCAMLRLRSIGLDAEALAF